MENAMSPLFFGCFEEHVSCAAATTTPFLAALGRAPLHTAALRSAPRERMVPCQLKVRLQPLIVLTGAIVSVSGAPRILSSMLTRRAISACARELRAYWDARASRLLLLLQLRVPST